LDYFNGDVDSASKRFRAALGVFHELGSTLESCETLEGLAAVEVARGDLDSARRFSGSAKLLRRESGIHASFIARIGHFETRRRLRATLDENIGSLHVTHADAMAWINLALQQ
jgi:hypothetical protein